MKKNIIKFKNIEVQLGGKTILRNISFTLIEKEPLCIIGEGSSGKTTLLKSILGLAPITSGEILINEVSLNKNNYLIDNHYFNKFGVVFQKDALFDSLLVWENIMFKKLNLNFKKEELVNQAKRLLKKVDMDEQSCFLYPSELSGGMKKRVAIARAVSTNPSFLILDEPTAGLDPIKTNKIFTIIKNLSQEFNVTVMAVTSDMKGALKYFKKILMLRNSTVYWHGNSEEAKKQKMQGLQDILKKV